jgi:hypothetical protein
LFLNLYLVLFQNKNRVEIEQYVLVNAIYLFVKELSYEMYYAFFDTNRHMWHLAFKFLDNPTNSAGLFNTS